MSSSNTVSKFKVLLLGDNGVGKSEFIHRYVNDCFIGKYLPNMGPNITPITLSTTKGDTILYIWVCAGYEEQDGKYLPTNFYTSADAAIIMLDVTKKSTMDTLHCWYELVKIVNPNIPIIICGNKFDSDKHKFKLSDIDIKENNLKYYNISVLNKYNLQECIKYILSQLMNDSSLELIHYGNKINKNETEKKESISLWVAYEKYEHRDKIGGKYSGEPYWKIRNGINFYSSKAEALSSKPKYVNNYWCVEEIHQGSMLDIDKKLTESELADYNKYMKFSW